MFYRLIYIICSGLSFLFFPLKVYGRENLPKHGPYIIASNHISNLDPVLIGLSIARPISYVAKDSLFKYPVFGWTIRNLGAFPLRRGRADIGSVRESMRRLKRGSALLVFPEGSRRGVKTDDKVFTGIGFLAAKSGAVVIPARVMGSDQSLPPGKKWPRRRPVAVRFGKPLSFHASDAYLQVTEQIMTQIASL